MDIKAIRARHEADALPISALDPRSLAVMAHEDRGVLLAEVDRLRRRCASLEPTRLRDASEAPEGDFVKRSDQQLRYGHALDLIIIALALFGFWWIVQHGVQKFMDSLPVASAQAAVAPRPTMTVTVRARRDALPGLYGCGRST